jgi:hypothetical protein
MKFELNDYHRDISDEELLQDLINISQKNEIDFITISLYKKYGKYSYTTFQRRFGSFTNALKQAGLSISKVQTNHFTVTKEEIISDMKSLYSKMGELTSKNYDKKGKYGVARIYKLFGSWESALLEADIPLKGGSKHISDLDLFKEIENIWIKLGRQPTSTDIKNGISLYSLNTFSRRFGSWRNALECFVSYINETTDEDTETVIIESHLINENKSEYKHSTNRDVNLRLRFQVMKRDNFKCCNCGRSPATTQGLELHIDHIKPWAKGGETVIDNLQTLCQDCNLGKSDLE